MKRSRSKLKLAQAHDLPWVSVEFPSSLKRVAKVTEEILAACQRHRFNEQDLFAIKLAIEEALVNAVKHGNRLDGEKRVRVQYRVTDQRLDVAVEDQGGGFNPADLPDPTADENLCRCCGRGILLMRAYMSNVVFNPQGNKVTLTKFNENCPSESNAAIG
ncbi:MAG: ATP-binding protein [Phycisphaerales bacterium]|nr:ATP-binding protein [Phycisphaerales bacterium]